VSLLKKRTGLILTFLLITGAAFFLLYRSPDILFASSQSAAWNAARCLLFAVLIALMVTGAVFAVLERVRLAPYFAKLLKYRPLLYQLVRRDFLAKYKRSVLGVLWSVLSPLLTMLIMTIVFSHIFRFDIENFPVYLLSGQIVFTLFSESTNMCMSAVLGAASLMKKVNVPKYIFPISRAISGLINFSFSFVALLLVMLITRSPFHPQMLLIPVGTLYVFVFSTGIGLLLSALVVFFRDINYLYGIFLTAVTYFTPLFYPISIIPDRFRWVISLNPLYHYVQYFRTVAIYGGVPSLWQNVICIALALFSLGAGLFVFYKKQDDFILYI
jgi:ABC-2 type transport system permease protein